MATDVSAPIVAPKTGQAFLESTSFQISQDRSITSDSMKSIFKQDYPPYHHYGRTKGARPPPLSEVMHKDERFFSEKESETVAAFEDRGLPKVEGNGSYVNLSSTNFKMDSDTNKFNSFNTMHNTYFTPKMSDNFEKLTAPTTYESHIPQGDKEKELQPLSDYRHKFQGHDTRVHMIEKVPPMHDGKYGFLKVNLLPIYAEWTLLSQLFGQVHFLFSGCLFRIAAVYYGILQCLSVRPHFVSG